MKAILLAFSAASLVLATFVPLAADASELQPLEAGTFVLGDHTVSVYYTVNGDAYEVTTTIAAGADHGGAPIRFVGFLLPGQKALVSAGQFGTTTAPETLELTHQGGLLLATQAAEVTAAK